MSTEDNAEIAKESSGTAVGDLIEVRDVYGEWHPRKVIGFGGWNFPCVFVCTVDEWNDAGESGYEPEGVPWPAEDVRQATR